MNYHCPQCSRTLKVANLFFHDITACPDCGQKVVLGDFFAFAFAALTMLVAALTALYVLSHEFEEYFVAAGYALAIGMAAGLAVMLLLGRATPFKRRGLRRDAPPRGPQPSH
jgi:uncharacterized paraquat-inducible protein A